jgi:D-lyxose ketol-isomerase
MKRSEINETVNRAAAFFQKNGWALPPNPRWDVTDFGLGDFNSTGLVLVNLAEEAEYCEKLMYCRNNQVTPAHTHKKKKEDIICRNGLLIIQLWTQDPLSDSRGQLMTVKRNGVYHVLQSGEIISLTSGERITIEPGIWHSFYGGSPECIIGEVSTANDDVNDNIFSDERIGRFSTILEDEPPLIKLVNDN